MYSRMATAAEINVVEAALITFSNQQRNSTSYGNLSQFIDNIDVILAPLAPEQQLALLNQYIFNPELNTKENSLQLLNNVVALQHCIPQPLRARIANQLIANCDQHHGLTRTIKTCEALIALKPTVPFDTTTTTNIIQFLINKTRYLDTFFVTAWKTLKEYSDMIPDDLKPAVGAAFTRDLHIVRNNLFADEFLPTFENYLAANNCRMRM